jgi:hypothetical protein
MKQIFVNTNPVSYPPNSQKYFDEIANTHPIITGVSTGSVGDNALSSGRSGRN